MNEEWLKGPLQMISDCEDRESQLTDWETNFIESLSEQIYEKKSISLKQVEVLEKIWERVTERG